MARLAKRPTPDDSDDENRVEEASSPSASFSSDKENQSSATSNARGKARMSALGSSSAQGGTPGSNKRMRLSLRDGANREDREESMQVNGVAGSQFQGRGDDLGDALNDITNKDFYDPEQPMEERRKVRRDIRDLSKNMNGMTAVALSHGEC